MISLEMFGSDIIRIKINGYLRNNTENNLISFNEKGIKNKNKISFVFDNVKYSIKINDNNVILIFNFSIICSLILLFTKNDSRSNYYLKEHCYSVDLNIDTKILEISDNKIYIKYVVIDTESEYELMIEMGDIL